MSGELLQQDFAQCLNERFQVVGEYPSSFDLELLQVSEEKATQKQRIFSILFRGPRDKFMPQRTYTLENNRLGVREIFLVPVGLDEQGYQYQAVFNYVIRAVS